MTDYTERVKARRKLGPKEVSIDTYGNLYFGKEVYAELNQPDAVRLFHSGSKIAIKPCEKSHRNAYIVTENHDITIVGLLKTDMGYSEDAYPSGRYQIEYDSESEFWVVDLSDGDNE